jgi:arylsulfatase A-like enzyme
LLHAAGWNTALVTDEPLVAVDPRSEHFGARIVLPVEPKEAPAQDVVDTQLVRLFAAATQWLEGAREPFLLWIHAQGMYGAWDAPLDYRRRFVEEDDPQPPEFALVPNVMLPENHDPDVRLGYRYAYGGQALLVDLCLEALLDGLDATGVADRTLLSVCGGRGFPLGEHRRVGLCDAALYEELVHAPWLMRVPGQPGGLSRSANLVQPSDLFAALISWCELHEPNGDATQTGRVLGCADDDSWPPRDRICLCSSDGFAGQRAIRTPAWYLRQVEAGPVELYAKPDDRFEVNDVAVRCAAEAESLAQALDDTIAAARAGTLDSLPPLDDLLLASQHG